MFVEGLIDKDYLEIVKAWGHKPDWIINTVKEAAEKGYDGYNPNTFTGRHYVIVRIWVEMDMEDFFSPEDMIRENKTLPDSETLQKMN